MHDAPLLCGGVRQSKHSQTLAAVHRCLWTSTWLQPQAANCSATLVCKGSPTKHTTRCCLHLRYNTTRPTAHAATSCAARTVDLASVHVCQDMCEWADSTATRSCLLPVRKLPAVHAAASTFTALLSSGMRRPACRPAATNTVASIHREVGALKARAHDHDATQHTRTTAHLHALKVELARGHVARVAAHALGKRLGLLRAALLGRRPSSVRLRRGGCGRGCLAATAAAGAHEAVDRAVCHRAASAQRGTCVHGVCVRQFRA
jgi:hypothetical protein